MVLGFGVIWWSIATALTPVAAKLGLPFLLVVRAFMGIGEVISIQYLQQNNFLSFFYGGRRLEMSNLVRTYLFIFNLCCAHMLIGENIPS